MTQGEGCGVRAQVKAYNATGKRQSTHGKGERKQVKRQMEKKGTAQGIKGPKQAGRA